MEEQKISQNNTPQSSSINRKVMLIAVIAIVLLSFETAILVKPRFKGQSTPQTASATKSEEANQKDESIDYWTCSMHPFVKQAVPGKCPVCAMDLIPVKKSGMANSSMMEENTFTISAQRQQLIGVKLTEVKSQNINKTIRAVGNIVVDETKMVEVQTKFSGWIDKVFANQLGQHVKKGDPLFTIYSPELVATQEEYLLAWRGTKQFEHSEYKEVVSMDSLLNASRRRLSQWDVSKEQIDSLEQIGKAERTLTVYAPASGHIIMKNALSNMQVTPDSKLYTIADHSKVWVNVDVFETDLAMIKLGQSAKMTVPAYPDKEFFGKVTFIAPHLNGETRTLKVRLEFANPNLLLKPEMYSNIEFEIPMGEKIVIPESAVIRTGKQNIAFVSLGEGRFALRNILLGMKFDGWYEVLSGLETNEQIVTSANFLVDAESKLQGIKSSWQEEESPKEK
jgi:membrane fusion protein, copper/silver efflux system